MKWVGGFRTIFICGNSRISYLTDAKTKSAVKIASQIISVGETDRECDNRISNTLNILTGMTLQLVTSRHL